MGPAKSSPHVTQYCGAVFDISGANDTVSTLGTKSTGRDCVQKTGVVVKGGNTGVDVDPTIAALLQNLAVSGIDISSIKTLTVANQQNQGV